MRRLALSLLQIFVSIATIGQSCLPEGILFATQAQIDSFAINYPGCTCIEGDVQILGTDISDLGGLGVLDSIKGNFTIGHFWNAGNPDLENLDGLENLSYIGGDLVIQRNESLLSMEALSGLNEIRNNIKIEGNPLFSLSGLEGIDTIHAELYIAGNDGIADLTGLDNIKCMEGRLSLYDNENLHNLAGLYNLNRIEEGMIIESNEGLVTLTGLDNLHAAGFLLLSGNYLISLTGLENLDTLYDGLSIVYNSELTSLDGLSGLTYIGGGINLEMNQSLASLEGLSALTFLGGELRLVWNTALTSLSGLENIDPGSISHIRIYLNQNLSQCDVASLCNYLSSPNGSVSIFNNDTGCNNPHEIADDCGIALSCLPYGNYHFTCQADVDSFSSYYPGCNHLQGEVWIEGDDISSLNELSGIDTISGNLYICWNPELTTLMGLHHLKTITEDFCLGYWEHGSSQALTDLTGLNGLSSVGEYMLILGNNGLTSLSGLDSLGNVGEHFEIIENRSLISLEGLDHLNTLKSISIGGNDSLLTLEGLQNLINVDEGISVSYNPLLYNLNGISNILADSLDFLRIQHNSSLSQCNVQSVCDFLGISWEHVYIDNNDTGCNSPEEVELSCEVGMDDADLQNDIFRIYPNPATNEIFIETREIRGISEISILNLNGKEVVHQNISGKKTVIAIGSLPCGMYLVRSRSDTGISVQKFVKF